ncbi:MAG: MBL fold metallo-hydrolase [Bacteroidaceae bacterium]|nr:MBL fold metallo-hydrolase [Bacteroidaceae bacterium]
MLQFISFGSGSCGNCYCLSDGNSSILVDAGVSPRRLKRYFRDYGINQSTIRALIITHDHADHIKAAGKISSELKIPVYATELVHEGITRNFHVRNKIESEYVQTIEKDKTFEIGLFKITPFEIPHDSMQNVGYSIEHEGEIFTIMTDVGAPTDNVKHYISISNHIVIEANYDVEMLVNGKYPLHLKQRIMSGTGHLSNRQTAEALAENFHAGLQNVWLCHLSEENNHPELARKTIEQYLRSYGIIADADFTLEVLRRKIPTGPFNISDKENSL